MKISTALQQPDLDSLQKNLGLSFKNPALLKNAFIHRSYLNEHKESDLTSNERLEFLGDSVLSIIVSQFLFDALKDSPEGQLTQLRSTLVRTETLAKLARHLQLGKYLFLAKGEEESGGRTNQAILANTYEALLGALYLDSGFVGTQKFIEQTILTQWENLVKSAVVDNKSKLQEVLQRIHHRSPSYKLLKTAGPDHNRTFEIAVYMGDEQLGIGSGKNKQTAAQDAAKAALGRLKAQNLG